MNNEKKLDWSAINYNWEQIEPKKANISAYFPLQQDSEESQKILKKFSKAWLVMSKPRPEFDDLSAVDAYQYDLLVYNNYQMNNGMPITPNLDWRDNSTSPIARNRSEELVADILSKFPDPKIIARDSNNNLNEEGALIMGDLFDIAKYKSKWNFIKRDMVSSLSYSPACYLYVGYEQVIKKVKTKNIPKKDGQKGEIEWEYDLKIDEDKSGQKIVNVPFDQIYIPNVFEKNIQNQSCVFWRRVISYDDFRSKYAKYDNAKYVKPGAMNVYMPQNNFFYEITDRELGGDKVEELLYWNKGEDCFHIICNGIKLTKFGNPNPRIDKNYPFAKIRPGFIRDDFSWGKSYIRIELPDDRIYNRARQMVTDGHALEIMRPLQYTGTETVDPNAVRPGSMATSLTGEFKPLLPPNNLRAGVQWLQVIQNQIEKDLAGANPKGASDTAYGDAMEEQKANKLLLAYLLSCADLMMQVSELVLSDICQFMTLLDVKNSTTADRSYLVTDAKTEDGIKNRKIVLDATLDTEFTKDQALKHAIDIMEEEGKDDVEIYKLNPKILRSLKYDFIIELNAFVPMSEEIRAQMDQNTFNQAIGMNKIMPMNNKELLKDLIFSHNDKTKRNPDKYFKEEEPTPSQPNPMPNPQDQSNPMANTGANSNTPSPVNSPINNSGRPLTRQR